MCKPIAEQSCRSAANQTSRTTGSGALEAEAGTDMTLLTSGDRGPGPHFFCIGPAKSATTWIADHLKLHRDVWLPPMQEVSYLAGEFHIYRDTVHLDLGWDPWSLIKRLVRNKSLSAKADRQFLAIARDLAAAPPGTIDLDGYRRLFEPAGGRLTGDISPVYARLGVEEIRRVAPAFEGRPIFAIARDPVQRFWSAMSMYYRYRTFGDIDYGSLEAATMLFHDPLRSRQHFLTQVLDRWTAALGNNRVKIFFFDDIAERPEQTFRKVVDFIGGDYSNRLPLVAPGYNRQGGSDRAPISPEAREWVRRAFKPELEASAQRFGPYGERWLRRHTSGDEQGKGSAKFAAGSARQ